MEQNITVTLRDIKPLIEIPDSSYYLYFGFIGLGIFLGLVVIIIVARYLWKLWRGREIYTTRRYLKILETLDWSDTKAAAYQATVYARLLATDEKRKALFVELEVLLQGYKYQKEVNALDVKTRKQLDHYVQVVHESL